MTADRLVFLFVCAAVVACTTEHNGSTAWNRRYALHIHVSSVCVNINVVGPIKSCTVLALGFILPAHAGSL